MSKVMQQLAAVLGVAALVSGCTADRVGGHVSAPPPAYVRCVGQFTDLEPDYPWFVNWVDPDGNESHGDGSSPRAVFRIVSPTNHADRIVGVLYKYQGKDLPSPPDAGDKGKTFSFELPEDFFTGNFVTIDNSIVRNLKREPQPEAGGYRR
jgi:hypothetical protein